jgi:TusA-related sulfurtransferase
MSAYPEHDKLAAISDQSQAIHDFIEWCEDEKRIYLEHVEDRPFSLRDLLAEHFGIDLAKINQEKAAMVDALREANAS